MKRSAIPLSLLLLLLLPEAAALSASAPLSVPEIPDFRVLSGGSVDTVFPAATGGRPPYAYSLAGLPPGIAFTPSTRRASGTLPTVTTDSGEIVKRGVNVSSSRTYLLRLSGRVEVSVELTGMTTDFD